MSERRIAAEQRRVDDRHVCAIHEILQDETRNHRTLVCGKILDVKKTAEGAVPRWVFVLATGALLTLAGIAWTSINTGQAEIKKIIQDGNDEINHRMSTAASAQQTIATTQAVVVTRLTAVEKQLDRLVNGGPTLHPLPAKEK